MAPAQCGRRPERSSERRWRGSPAAVRLGSSLRSFRRTARSTLRAKRVCPSAGVERYCDKARSKAGDALIAIDFAFPGLRKLARPGVNADVGGEFTASTSI